MNKPTFDGGEYPTDETVEALSDWLTDDPAGALDFLAEAWNTTYGSVRTAVTAGEASVLMAQKADRFLRLATGGWSGNEQLVKAFMESGVGKNTWRLHASGGLWIFCYPK